MSFQVIGINSLPVELLYDIELYALSENLPHASHHFNDVYKQASPFFHAKYIIGRVIENNEINLSEVYTKALRYPLCTQKVVEAMQMLLKDFRPSKSAVQLPRRLFKNLAPPTPGWSKDSYPIPFLRYLYNAPEIPRINTNANEGYALTRAVHARFNPLVQFLLAHHASPACRDNLAVKVAVRQKNLEMVKLLVERKETKKKGKRRKFEDRLTLDSDMLKIAVMANAQDIVEYLYREKKILPDLQTLKKMT
ncbi:hypothetical protein JR316_0005947 [Psilocybe cubensis]|uniref:Uncharacterized protein n=2 Tax=Psilocybe cubensis TaxID=181762 RepID=A0A8H7Y072_PSICU|nr:hypothetical protein JR316_0005947 [Psilocybe cubensis]KAH9481421.1 hypothetical protein JR316_0005947 [Psilocybe cubensis]